MGAQIKIQADELAKAIEEIVGDYTQEVKTAVDNVLGDVAKETVGKVKEKSPVRTGAYKRGWTVTKEKTATNTRFIVRNKTKYMLTHLLEKGHANRGGGFTEGTPHIAPAEEWAVNEAYRQVVKEIEG